VFGKDPYWMLEIKRGADVGSDNHLVITKIKLKIASNRDKKMDTKSTKTNVQKLNIPEIKEEFKLELRNRFSILEAVTDMGNINQKWTQVKDIFIESSEKIRKQQKSMDNRRNVENDSRKKEN
jgi:hypothetical protein